MTDMIAAAKEFEKIPEPPRIAYIRSLVNNELRHRGLREAGSITMMGSTVFAHREGSTIKVGTFEYVSGLGEIFDYTYNPND